jgi:hypothetical protein
LSFGEGGLRVAERDWRAIQVAGLRPVEKVIAVYRISDCRTEDRLRFPFPLFSVAVSESLHGGYTASPNVAIRNADGNADWIGGHGETVEAALEDCLRHFMDNIGQREWLRDEDFYWSVSSVDRCDGRTEPGTAAGGGGM